MLKLPDFGCIYSIILAQARRLVRYLCQCRRCVHCHADKHHDADKQARQQMGLTDRPHSYEGLVLLDDSLHFPKAPIYMPRRPASLLFDALSNSWPDRTHFIEAVDQMPLCNVDRVSCYERDPFAAFFGCSAGSIDYMHVPPPSGTLCNIPCTPNRQVLHSNGRYKCSTDNALKQSWLVLFI